MIVWPALKRASLAGLSNDGAGSVPLAAGLTVKMAVRLTPPKVAVSVTAVADATDVVVAANVALVAPAATVTLAGTVTALFALVSATCAPPVGAAAVRVTVPVEEAPPTTLVGETATVDRVGVAGAATGVNRLVDENGPNTPDALRARTRHHSCCAGSAPIDACDTVTIWLAVNGAEMVDVLSTWIS